MFAMPVAQFTENLVQHYLNMAATTGGVVLITAFVLVAALTVAFPGLRWAHLALAMYAGTFAIGRLWENQSLTPPFSWFGQVGQPATAGLLLLMLIATVRPPPVRRRRLCIGLFVALLAFQIVIAGRTAAAGFTIRAAGIMAIWSMMFVAFAVGLANWLYDRAQLSHLIRAVAWAAGLMVVGNILQFILAPGAVFANGRMFGTTPNPQRLGIYLAMALPFCAYAALEARGGRRLIYGSIAGASLVMIAATGSRTGMVAAALSMLVFFRAQVGRAMLFVAAGLLAGVIGYLVIGEAVGFGLARFREANTRTELWSQLFQTFLSSPLIGVGTEGASGESTYLSVAASAGLLGLIPALVFVGMLLWVSARLLRARRTLGPDYARIADLVAAVFVPVVVVSFTFEAYMMGTLTDFMLVLYATMALAGTLLERLTDPQAATVEPGEMMAEPWPGGMPTGRYAGEAW